MDLKKIFGIVEIILFVWKAIRKKQAPAAPQKETDETPSDDKERVA